MISCIKFLPQHFVSKINDTHPYCNRETVKTKLAPGISKMSWKSLTHEGSYHYFVSNKKPPRWEHPVPLPVPADAQCVFYLWESSERVMCFPVVGTISVTEGRSLRLHHNQTSTCILEKIYRNFPKYSDTQKTCCNHSKIWTMWL